MFKNFFRSLTGIFKSAPKLPAILPEIPQPAIATRSIRLVFPDGSFADADLRADSWFVVGILPKPPVDARGRPQRARWELYSQAAYESEAHASAKAGKIVHPRTRFAVAAIEHGVAIFAPRACRLTFRT